jgi:C4-dicarboxylate-specific signal transduction histidine kinase
VRKKPAGRVEVNLPENQSVQGNNNRLTQVFVNLLQNSVDGLREKSFDGEKPTIWINGRVDSEKSIVIIRDNGQGIEPQNIGKIFDPFFTTKDVGQGMGLGLSICYRIVQEYQGQIRVKSERGKFCEFTLEFLAKPAQ